MLTTAPGNSAGDVNYGRCKGGGEVDIEEGLRERKRRETRAAFEAGPGGPGPDRDLATAALRLLAGGLSGYAVRTGPTEGLPA